MIFVRKVAIATCGVMLAAAIFTLGGCSSFNLGAMSYCPHGQACETKVAPK